MTEDDADTVLRDALRHIAPEVEIDDIDQEGDLREEFDIDSMDFLNLVTALSKTLGIEMPEADYPQMATYAAMRTYLATHAA